jgi:hypothetical protein
MISMHVHKFKKSYRDRDVQRQRCAETEMCRDRDVQRQRFAERVGICGCAGQGKAMTGLECRGVQRSGLL